MASPPPAPRPGTTRRTRLRSAIIAAAAAVLLVFGAYAVATASGVFDDATPAAQWRPAASPAHPAPAEASPGAAEGAWQFQPSLPRAAPASTSPAAVGLPPSDAYGGPFGTQRRTGAGYAALTFDDGPDPRWTPQVLDLLRSYGVRATFCITGQAAEAYPDLVRAIAADGHTLCNHSWDHDMALGQRSREEIRQDLQRATAAIQAAVPGVSIAHYRQPGGNWTARVVEVAAELGMISVHWDVDPRDWSLPGVDAIVAEIHAQTRADSIVLLHDGDGDRVDGGSDRSQTVDALSRILPDLTSRLRLDALSAPR